MTALLELTDRYGLGAAAGGGGKAILASVPQEWIHDIVMGLDRRMPAACRGTRWHLSISESMAKHWKPRRVPEDLLEAWKALPSRDNSMSMFLACAEADLSATRRFLTTVPDEQRLGHLHQRNSWHVNLASAAIQVAIKSAPGELPGLIDTSPRLEFIGYAYVFAGMSEVEKAVKDPALRRTIAEQLPAMKDQRRRLMLERIVLSAEPVPERMARVEAIADPAARAYAATVAAAPTTESLEWWASQVPRDQQPVLGALMAEDYMLPGVMLPWLERMGEATGGQEFDRLRMLAAQHHGTREGAPHAQATDIANRITDPALRVPVLGRILRSGDNWKRVWIEQNLSPEEQADFLSLMPLPPR